MSLLLQQQQDRSTIIITPINEVLNTNNVLSAIETSKANKVFKYQFLNKTH